jgi:hypothetical protein
MIPNVEQLMKKEADKRPQVRTVLELKGGPQAASR